jgi:hypothetical protein
MVRSRSTLVGVLYGVIAIGLHVWGRYKDWWWYDNLAHLAAGISLGGLIASEDSPLGQDLLLVGALTALWEAAEYVTGTYPWGELPDRAAAEETLLDSLLVAIGAAVAAGLIDTSET